jgi:hypothetical protein
MTTLVVLFNLKPGVTPGDYERWAVTTDLPTVRGLSSVHSFDVYRALGVLGSDAPSPYAYVEMIDVPALQALFDDLGTPVMQKVAAEFQTFADQPLFLVTERFS